MNMTIEAKIKSLRECIDDGQEALTDPALPTKNAYEISAMVGEAYRQLNELELDVYGDPMPMQPDSSDIAQMRE